MLLHVALQRTGHVSAGPGKIRQVAGHWEGDKGKLTSPSPGMLPNRMPAPSCGIVAGGLPPLAEGCGIGEGGCAGDGTWLCPGMAMGAEALCWECCARWQATR